MLDNHLHYLKQEHQPPRERVLFNKPFHDMIHYLNVAAKVAFWIVIAKWLEISWSKVGAATSQPKAVMRF
jgi:hypothetical protein